MYTRIRHYRVKDPEEVTRRVKESFVPLVRQVPGFLGYYIVEGDGAEYVSVSVFETREGAEEAHRLSTEWTAEHLLDLVEAIGEALIGDTIIAETPEQEREERRAA